MTDSRKLRIGFVVRYWDMVKSRPHHLVEQARAKGHRVEIFTEYGDRWYRTLRRKSYPAMETGRHMVPSLTNVAGRGLSRLKLFSKASLTERVFAKFVSSRAIARLGTHFDVVIYCSDPVPVKWPNKRMNGVFLYDCMDDWSGFPFKSGDVVDWERSICAKADIVAVVSEPLAERLRSRGIETEILVVPNAVDVKDFCCPATKSPHEQGPPTVGYLGSIDEWFDWDIVLHLARSMPEIIIVLVGPHRGELPQLPPNVILEGKQPYSKMPDYLAKFDVCIIPFDVRIPYVKTVSPIKLYEYLAAGKVVVSTSLPDARNFEQEGIVYVADTATDFVAVVKEAMNMAREDVLVKTRLAIAESNTWAKRWEVLETAIRRAIQDSGSQNA